MGSNQLTGRDVIASIRPAVRIYHTWTLPTPPKRLTLSNGIPTISITQYLWGEAERYGQELHWQLELVAVGNIFVSVLIWGWDGAYMGVGGYVANEMEETLSFAWCCGISLICLFRLLA